MLPKTSPNYLQYKIHKRWLLSWIHFIVIIRVTTFECFKMQMVINLAPVSLSNKKVNFYTCPRLTFLKKNATENAYKSISEPLDFKIFLRLRCSKIASSCSEVWLRSWVHLRPGPVKGLAVFYSKRTTASLARLSPCWSLLLWPRYPR